MGAVIDLETIRVKKDNWFKRTGRKVKLKVKQAYWWIKDNPAEAALLGSIATAAIGGAVKVTKGAIKSHNLKKEQYNKEMYVYDHSLGAYLKLNRPLTNNDIVEVRRRMADGKTKADVLAEMGLLE